MMYLQASASFPKAAQSSLRLEMPISTPKSHPGPSPKRFEFRTDCEKEIEVLYLAREGTTYTRVDDFCVSETYVEHLLTEPVDKRTPTCSTTSCGYSSTRKGYLMEPAILEAISGASRMLETKRSSKVTKYHEQNATVQSTKNSSITKFKLTDNIKCASKLETSKDQLVGSQFHLFQSQDLHDHMSSRNTFFEVSKKNNTHKMLVHFDRTFSQRDHVLTINETIFCESPEPIDFRTDTLNFDIEIVSESDKSWGIFAMPPSTLEP